MRHLRTAADAIGLPEHPDSDAVRMFRVVLVGGRSLIRQRDEIEARAVALPSDLPDCPLLTTSPGIGPIHTMTILAEAGGLPHLPQRRAERAEVVVELRRKIEAIQRLNEELVADTTLEGVRFGYPGAGGFRLEVERLEVAATLKDDGLGALEAHYPNEINEDNVDLNRAQLPWPEHPELPPTPDGYRLLDGLLNPQRPPSRWSGPFPWRRRPGPRHKR